MVETLKIDYKLRNGSKIKEVDFSNIPFGRIYSDHMFKADYINGEWRNFAIEPYDFLQFEPGAAVLHYGQSVFEGLKAYKNDQDEIMVFRPEMNYKRLNISAERLCIPQIPEEVFLGGMTELLKIDKSWIPNVPNTSLYIRPVVFASDEYIGIRPSETYKFIIFTCPVGAYYPRPVKVKVETKYSRSVEGGTGFAKAGGNYSGSLYPARLAQKMGYDQLIWTDGKTHQFVEEAGTMNVMFIIDNTLITADTGDTVLKGITRDSVLTIARDWGIKVEERKIPVSEVVEAIKGNRLVEAFGTGTAATIANISLIGHEGQDYTLPPITEQNFSRRVLRELNNIMRGVSDDKYDWVYKID